MKLKNIKNIKNITISLLKKISDTEERKSEFLKTESVSFEFPTNMIISESMFKELLNKMFEDLLNVNKSDSDYIGIWVNTKKHLYENSIPLQTLNDMKLYTIDNVNVMWEFFKMSTNYKT